MEKARIAVCLSGQLRTYKKCLPNIAKFFNSVSFDNRKVEVDYFIHTWDSNLWFKDGKDKGKKINGRSNLDISEYKFDPIDFQFLYSTLNIKDILVESSSAYRRYSDCIPHWDSLFYSFFKSVELKAKYENHNNFKYDFVFKARTDIIFRDHSFNYSIDKLEPRTFLASCPPVRFSNEHNMFNVDDIIFGTSSEDIDFLSNIYQSFVKSRMHKHSIEDYSKFPSSCGPGVILYRYLTDCNFKINYNSPIHYIIGRQQMLDLDLEVIDDFKLIEKYHNEFY